MLEWSPRAWYLLRNCHHYGVLGRFRWGSREWAPDMWHHDGGLGALAAGMVTKGLVSAPELTTLWWSGQVPVGELRVGY